MYEKIGNEWEWGKVIEEEERERRGIAYEK